MDIIQTLTLILLGILIVPVLLNPAKVDKREIVEHILRMGD